MVNGVHEWSGAAVKLLKGPVYENEDRKTWSILIRFRENLEAYFRVIGLHVVTEEEDGYAYLEQVKDSVEKGMCKFPFTYFLLKEVSDVTSFCHYNSYTSMSFSKVL